LNTWKIIYIKSLDSAENRTERIPLKPNKPFVYSGRYHPRIRRQNDDPMANLDTASTVLSILPLDRIGTIIGQLMATGLKDMFNPDVGKKLIDVVENQAPLLLTSLFTNLYSTLGVPVRTSSTTNLGISSVSNTNNNAIRQLTNSSTSQIINAIRRPTAK